MTPRTHLPEAPTDAIPDRGVAIGPAPLGEMLVRSGRISSEHLVEALALQRADGDHRLLGEILVDRGLVSEAELAEAREALSQTKAEAEAKSATSWPCSL